MTCDKRTFNSKSEANTALRGILSDSDRYKGRNKKNRSMKAYKCSECGLFHLTTLGKRHKDGRRVSRNKKEFTSGRYKNKINGNSKLVIRDFTK